MEMKSKVILLSANPYSMKDENSGRKNEGVSCNYVVAESLVPFKENDFLGYRVMKGSIPLDNLEELKQVPCVCEADFILKSDNGKAVLKPIKFKFLKALA